MPLHSDLEEGAQKIHRWQRQGRRWRQRGKAAEWRLVGTALNGKAQNLARPVFTMFHVHVAVSAAAAAAWHREPAYNAYPGESTFSFPSLRPLEIMTRASTAKKATLAAVEKVLSQPVKIVTTARLVATNPCD